MNTDVRTFEIKVPACPLCHGKWKYYNGAMGYESLVCSNCHFDIAEIKIKP